MKLIRILIIIVIAAGIVGLVYYLTGHEKQQKEPLRKFLNSHAAIYYQHNEQTNSRIIEWSNPEKESQESMHNFISNSSSLSLLLDTGQAYVSWHLTRQNSLKPVFWLSVPDNYEFSLDSAVESKPIGSLLEVKSPQKFFIAEGAQFIAFGADGEIMEQLSTYDFLMDDSLGQMPLNRFYGNLGIAQKYANHTTSFLRNFKVLAGTYQLDVYPSEVSSFYTLQLKLSSPPCGKLNTGVLNNLVPQSAVSAMQFSFTDAQCVQSNLSEQIAQQIWNAEDRYQFKLANLIDAWVEGPVTWMHCNFEGREEEIAMVKLRYDAAPFATGNRFFTEYESLQVNHNSEKKSYTVARMLPDELSLLLFSDLSQPEKLFVTQLNDHLYFSKNKQFLLLMMSELVNGVSYSGFAERPNNTGKFFFRFPEIWENESLKTKMDTISVEGSLGLTPSGVIIQGSVFNISK